MGIETNEECPRNRDSNRGISPASQDAPLRHDPPCENGTQDYAREQRVVDAASSDIDPGEDPKGDRPGWSHPVPGEVGKQQRDWDRAVIGQQRMRESGEVPRESRCRDGEQQGQPLEAHGRREKQVGEASNREESKEEEDI